MARKARGVRLHEDPDRRSLERDFEEQQSLFLELDPYIYRADQVLFQVLKSFSFERRTRSEKPRALLCPPNDAVGYQIGALSELFQATLFASDPDSLHDEVVRRFRCELIEDRIPESLGGFFDAVVTTNYGWNSESEFVEAVLTAQMLLTPGGMAVFVLPGLLTPEGGAILWRDGSETKAGAFEAGEVFRLGAAAAAELIPFSEVTEIEDDYLRRFLKRHRDYFGKAALGACLERMRDTEFTAALTGPDSGQRCALVVYWEDAAERFL